MSIQTTVDIRPHFRYHSAFASNTVTEPSKVPVQYVILISGNEIDALEECLCISCGGWEKITPITINGIHIHLNTYIFFFFFLK